MNKKEVKQRVLKNGKPLSKKLFSWCEETNTFSSSESGLVLDFSGVDSCTFKTSSGCTFNTGYDCTFNTGYGCVVIRRDIYEVIELADSVEIVLNGYLVKGFKTTSKHKITIDDKEIELSEESYNKLKESLLS